MKTQPRLNFWQIWNMSFGFLGIQFGFALQNANVSRIFESLGAQVEAIPILWIAAPVTGLIVQPIVGYLSDNTWGRFGRRRPFFLIGAIFASLALIIMPNSPYLWIAAGMLWILDASINISMEPFRAFVGDMLPPEQRTKGFAMQSFFIGIGAVVGSGLPYALAEWVGISDVPLAGQKIPPNVTFSFYIGAAIFFISVLWTVIRTKEYSPEELAEFEKARKTQNEDATEYESKLLPPQKFLKYAPFWILGGFLITAVVIVFNLKGELYILSGGIFLFGVIQLATGLLIKAKREKVGFVVVINDLYQMPKTMKQLAVVQFFSWFALFSMWIYTTAGVTSHHYNMKLDAGEITELTLIAEELKTQEDADWHSGLTRIINDLQTYQLKLDEGERNVVASMRVVNFFRAEAEKEIELSVDLKNSLLRVEAEYNKGANWVTALFSIYNGFAALLAFLLPVLARLTNRRITHMMALVLGGIGLISVYFISSPLMLIFAMFGVGIAWASILSMPYAILTGSLPANKMGTYMGIFNFFIVIPQILAASILGFFVTTIAGGQAIYALILGGFSLFIAAFTVLFVKDEDEARIKKALEE